MSINKLKEIEAETLANFNYKIESSSDLTNWKNYQTVSGTGESINYFLKNDAMNKFYRIRASAKWSASAFSDLFVVIKHTTHFDIHC